MTIRRLGSGLLLTSICWLLLAGAAQAAPLNMTAPGITGTPDVGQTLVEVPGTWDSTAVSYTYQWVDCPVGTNTGCINATGVGATTQNYDVAASDEGYSIAVQETAYDATPAASAPATSSPTAEVLPPPANGVPTITGTAVVGQTLTEAHGTWTNTPTSYTYQWVDCPVGTNTGCINATGAGATTQSYQVAASDEGYSIAVQETASNADGASATPGTSAATAEVLPPPVNSTVPTIGGITWLGQTLTEAHGTWTNTPTSYTYQWERCSPTCAAISGATGQTYVLTSTDVGDTIEVQETAINADGASVTPGTSLATATITLPPPTENYAPSISGNLEQGSTLTEKHGSWNNSPTSYSYEWIRCDGTGATCVVVAGQTAQTYVLTAADVGGTLVVVETATNAGGSNYAYSALTAVVTTPAGIVPPPVDASPPTTAGPTQQGGTLIASPGSWSNNPDAFTYQWMRCKGSSCAAIPGATGQTYTLSGADVGYAIEVQDTATNTGGTGVAVLSGRTPVITATSTTGLVTPSDPVTNQNVTLVATITSSSGNAAPSGSVTFKNRGGAIGGCSNEPIHSSSQSVTVTCQTSFHASTDTLSAVYAAGGGSLVTGSSSPTSALTVGRAPTSTSLTIAKQVSVGANTTFTVTVNPPASSSGPIQPSGSVEFLDAGKPIPACLRRPLRSQAATCRFKYKTTGTHRIEASYSGDSNFGGSSSSSHRLKAVRAVPKVLGIITSITNWTFHFYPAYTRVQLLVVTGVTSGSSVFVTCHGHGCPFAKHTTSVANKPHCVSKGKRRCSMSRTINLAPSFHGARLGVGSKITVSILRCGWIGKYYTFTVRRRQQPRSVISTLPVGVTRQGLRC